MEQFLWKYKPVELTTWVYLSSLLTVAIYFKFSRLWSVRNLDLLALIALAPGLLLIDYGGDVKYYGYIWLFGVGGWFSGWAPSRRATSPSGLRSLPMAYRNYFTAFFRFLHFLLSRSRPPRLH